MVPNINGCHNWLLKNWTMLCTGTFQMPLVLIVQFITKSCIYVIFCFITKLKGVQIPLAGRFKPSRLTLGCFMTVQTETYTFKWNNNVLKFLCFQETDAICVHWFYLHLLLVSKAVLSKVSTYQKHNSLKKKKANQSVVRNINYNHTFYLASMYCVKCRKKLQNIFSTIFSI